MSDLKNHIGTYAEKTEAIEFPERLKGELAAAVVQSSGTQVSLAQAALLDALGYRFDKIEVSGGQITLEQLPSIVKIVPPLSECPTCRRPL